jgi:actin-related protein
LNPRENRDVAAQILFETFNVPALYTSVQAVLSLYASGKTTGLVLDSGDGVSHAVPVFQGFAIPNSIRRIDVAGRDVTEHFQQLLRKSGRIFHTSAEKETVKNIKEATGYVALDPAKEEKEWSGAARSDGKSVEYSLPDGQKLKVSHQRRCTTTAQELTESRWAQNGFEHQKSCSILRSSAWSTLGCTRSWSRQYIGQTWTFENPSTATLCCPVGPH